MESAKLMYFRIRMSAKEFTVSDFESYNYMSGSFHFSFLSAVIFKQNTDFLGQPIFSFLVILTKKRKMKNGMNQTMVS